MSRPALALPLLVLACCAVPKASAATWERSYGTTAAEDFTVVRPGTGNALFLLGNGRSSSHDVVVAKLDGTGSVLWRFLYGGRRRDTPSGLVPTDDGGCLFVGTTYSFPALKNNAWMVRLDAAGSILWEKALDAGSDEFVTDAAPAPGGGFFVFGEMSGPYQGSWVLRMDSAGEILWERRYDLSYPVGMSTSSDGGLVLLGETATCDYGRRAVWVTKLAGSGGVLWSNWYVTEEVRDGASSVVGTPDGGAAFVTFGLSAQSPALTKLDSSGAVEWRVVYGLVSWSGQWALDRMPDGGLAMAGTWQSTFADPYDVAVIRVDDQGRPLWQRAYGRAPSDTWYEYATSVSSLADGGLAVGAVTEGTDPADENLQDAWILRTDASGSIASSCALGRTFALTSRPAASTRIPTHMNSQFLSFTVASTSADRFSYAVTTRQCGGAGDRDGDGVPDDLDDCLDVENQGQVDGDGDSLGDACDVWPLDPSNDWDGDGFCGGIDDCPNAFDPDQIDSDGDGRGDACEDEPVDPDVDDVCGTADNCPLVHNPDQHDADADAWGDLCDDCPLGHDPRQTDRDHDGTGDVCDLDDGLVMILLADRDHVDWQQEVGFSAWNLYEGDLSVLKATGVYTQSPGSIALADRHCGLAPGATRIDDFHPPPEGVVAFWLVTGVQNGVEGSLGRNSAGEERPNANPCP